MSFLVLMTGGKAGERYRLVKEKTILGRHPGCDIVVDSGSVSRQHAAVEMKDGNWWIEDLGSRNGTLINGEKLNGQHQLEAAEDEVSRIKNCYEYFEYCQKEMQLGHKQFLSKKGRGIYRRVFHWVPNTGPAISC